MTALNVQTYSGNDVTLTLSSCDTVLTAEVVGLAATVKVWQCEVEFLGKHETNDIDVFGLYCDSTDRMSTLAIHSDYHDKVNRMLDVRRVALEPGSSLE